MNRAVIEQKLESLGRCLDRLREKTPRSLSQLEDDIDGLVHISQLSEDHVDKVKDVIKVGDEVEARVIKVDKVERRIGLSIKAAEYSEEQLKKETAAFEALRPSSDLVGLEQAFNIAQEEWRPGEEPADAPAEEEGSDD